LFLANHPWSAPPDCWLLYGFAVLWLDVRILFKCRSFASSYAAFCAVRAACYRVCLVSVGCINATRFKYRCRHYVLVIDTVSVRRRWYWCVLATFINACFSYRTSRARKYRLGGYYYRTTVCLSLRGRVGRHVDERIRYGESWWGGGGQVSLGCFVFSDGCRPLFRYMADLSQDIAISRINTTLN